MERQDPVVLLVDDDAMYRTLVRNVLEELGAPVLEAQDVASGLQRYCALVAADRDVLLLSDLRMSDGDGIGLLAACRGHDLDHLVGAVVMTSHSDVVERARAGHGGAVVEAKPTGVHALVAWLQRLLEPLGKGPRPAPEGAPARHVPVRAEEAPVQEARVHLEEAPVVLAPVEEPARAAVQVPAASRRRASRPA